MGLLSRQTTAYALRSADTLLILPPQHVRTGYDFFKMHNQGPHEVYRALLLGGLPLIALAYADVIRDALVRRYGRPARSFGVCIS